MVTCFSLGTVFSLMKSLRSQCLSNLNPRREFLENLWVVLLVEAGEQL